ncbi:MAG: hypothetical protein OP8BY_1572 [Candidatus Saccharicenans subterraneus]|uniref:Uncharacterized protein n=1 Tax=Candidatus Saccharicenans subterraneus TaxID=2508984 RepID=A0A3E2BNV4_9BACT|nr:MAG: hypothetical protein OP8BY_1572 [Candidatus Saccharicenans subterraneum]
MVAACIIQKGRVCFPRISPYSLNRPGPDRLIITSGQDRAMAPGS